MLSESVRNDYETIDQVGIFSEFNELMRTWTISESNTENGLEKESVLVPQSNNYPFDLENAKKENQT